MRVSIKVSEVVRDKLKLYKGSKKWDVFLSELLESHLRLRSWVESIRLKFENYGNPDCDHEINSELETSGESYFIVWKCKKCGLKAYQLLGVREYSSEDVKKEAQEYWENLAKAECGDGYYLHSPLY